MTSRTQLKELAPGIRLSYIDEQLDKLNMSSDTEDCIDDIPLPHHISCISPSQPAFQDNLPLPKPPKDKIYSSPVRSSPQVIGAHLIATKYDSLSRYADDKRLKQRSTFETCVENKENLNVVSTPLNSTTLNSTTFSIASSEHDSGFSNDTSSKLSFSDISSRSSCGSTSTVTGEAPYRLHASTTINSTPNAESFSLNNESYQKETVNSFRGRANSNDKVAEPAGEPLVNSLTPTPSRAQLLVTPTAEKHEAPDIVSSRRLIRLDRRRLMALYSGLQTDVCFVCEHIASVTSTLASKLTPRSASTPNPSRYPGATPSVAPALCGVPLLVKNKTRRLAPRPRRRTPKSPVDGLGAGSGQPTMILLTDSYTGLALFKHEVVAFTCDSPCHYTFRDYRLGINPNSNQLHDYSGNSFTLRFDKEDHEFIIKLDECLFKNNRNFSKLNKKQLKEFKKSEKLMKKKQKIKDENEKKIYLDLKKEKGKISCPCLYVENVKLTDSNLIDHCNLMVRNIYH